MERMNRILELFWLMIFIISTILVVYQISTEGYNKGFNKWLVVIPLLALAVYFLRRGLRVKFEKQRREDLERKKKKK